MLSFDQLNELAKSKLFSILEYNRLLSETHSAKLINLYYEQIKNEKIALNKLLSDNKEVYTPNGLTYLQAALTTENFNQKALSWIVEACQECGIIDTPISPIIQTYFPKGSTALHIAIHTNNIKAVKLLIDNGANIDAIDNDKFPAIWYAITLGRSEMIEFIFSIKPDCKKTFDNGYNLMHAAVLANSPAMVEKFSNMAEIDINQEYNKVSIMLNNGTFKANLPKGYSPLHEAVRLNKTEALHALLKLEKLDINKLNNYVLVTKTNKYELHCKTVLHHAIDTNNIILTLILLNLPNIDLNAKDNYGASAIRYAALKGHTEIVKTLIEKGAKIEFEGGYKLIFAACIGGNKELIKLMIDQGQSLYENMPNGLTPFDALSIKFYNKKDILAEITSYKANKSNSEELTSTQHIFNLEEIHEVLETIGMDKSYDSSLSSLG
jgi:ankyrin repeat protein